MNHKHIWKSKAIKLFILWLVCVLIFTIPLLSAMNGLRNPDTFRATTIKSTGLTCVFMAVFYLPMLVWIMKCAKKENIKWLHFVTKFLLIYESIITVILAVILMWYIFAM